MRDRLLAALVRHQHAARFYAACLVLVHPLIHGTPLDSGQLDALIQQLQLAALS